ncbi:hypothetical protein AAC03nite_25640 [Alicyclobacillus acidoterrestris]|uniref:hypothetical protein n=1 Tax=Alicyclobacillus suci TaxID=2816080 RepID=UPI001197221B|nr:hypothetical protein [Alicyclobacillus suci]GEO26779.1 hypothetical protein AAC03nite_25640 [Alicyclobacillus acidoterrestris]
MNRRKSIVRIIVVGVLVLLVALAGFLGKYHTRYRLSAEAAARTNPGIGESSKLINKLHFSWGEVELFDSQKGYRSAVIEKRGLFWTNPATFVVPNDNSDTVRTVSLVSYSHVPNIAVTTLVVLTTSKNVAYIEAGPMSDRVKKPIQIGNPTVFSWNQMLNANDLNAIAYSKNGHELYEYGYPKNKSGINLTTDLRWYPVGVTH